MKQVLNQLKIAFLRTITGNVKLWGRPISEGWRKKQGVISKEEIEAWCKERLLQAFRNEPQGIYPLKEEELTKLKEIGWTLKDLTYAIDACNKYCRENNIKIYKSREENKDGSRSNGKKDTGTKENTSRETTRDQTTSDQGTTKETDNGRTGRTEQRTPDKTIDVERRGEVEGQGSLPSRDAKPSNTVKRIAY